MDISTYIGFIVVVLDFLQPVCLPSGTDVQKNYTGVKLVQPGWGINNEKVSNSVRVRSTVSLID